MAEIIHDQEPFQHATADELEKAMLEMPSVETVTNHYFCGGVYIRELHIPAGATCVGHSHKDSHFTQLTKGIMIIMDGKGGKEITAPSIMASQPGRKAVYALTDCTIQNIYATDETDVEVLEAKLVEKSAAWISAEKLKTLKDEVIA